MSYVLLLSLGCLPHAELCTVSWDTICTVFDVLLVNWDPFIFKNRLSFHGYALCFAFRRTADIAAQYMDERYVIG